MAASLGQKQFIGEMKKSVVLMGPVLAALLSQKGMQVMNSLVLGSLGSEALATAGLVDPMYTFLWSLGVGILTAVGVLTARVYSNSKADEGRRILYSSLAIAGGFSIFSMIALWHISGVLGLLGQDPLIIAQATEYMRALLWGMPALLVFFALLEFTSALNYPRVAMWVSIIGIPAVAAANYGFAYGKLGLPPMGIAGVGWSTSLVQWLMCIGFGIYISRHHVLKKYVAGSVMSGLSAGVAKEIIRIGLPTGVIYLLEMAMVFAMAVMMGSFGVVALAAHQILIMSMTVLCRFPMALCVTTTIRVSQNIGRKRYRRIWPSMYANLALGLSMGTVFGAVFALSPELVTDMFLREGGADGAAVAAMVKELIYLAALSQWVDYCLSVMNGGLRGHKDTFVPMLICLLAYWIIGIGGSYLMAYPLGMKTEGVWMGMFLVLSVVAAAFSLRFIMVHRGFFGRVKNAKGFPSVQVSEG